MKQKIEYTDAPEEVNVIFERGVIVPNFEITEEGIAAVVAKRAKKPVSIYLSIDTAISVKNKLPTKNESR